LSAARFIGLWAPVVVTIAAIHFASSRTLPAAPAAGLDKVLHFGAFLVLGALTVRACHAGAGPLRLLPSLGAFAIAAGYGALDEWHQSHVPGRHASAADWVADALGAGVALVLGSLILRRRPTA
jgi:VanZ family protein